MSDDKELIAEARQEESIQDKLGDGFSDGSEERAFYYEHRDRYKRLADALEARQSSVIDRDVAIDAIAGGTISVPGGYGVLHGDDAANIVDAIIGQAAVPDAATDLAQAKSDLKTVGAVSRSTFDKLKAERDAALAAIERVRAIAERHGMKPWTEEIFAALDGAPEPEWEWMSRAYFAELDRTWDSPIADEETARAMNRSTNDSEPGLTAKLMRRRKAGPWEPVDGEQP